MSYVAEIARSVTRYETADKTALRAFQAEHFGASSRQCNDRYFHWLFEKNPYRDKTGPSLWICKRDGAVVGQQASIPVMLKIGDVELRAAWGVDLMVHPQWRLRGVAPSLADAYEQSVDITLGAAMSEGAYKAFMRRGWSDLGMLPFLVRPLDPEACAQTSHAPQLLAKLAPAALTRGSAYAAGRVFGGVAHAQLQPVPAFDERVDALWALASADYSVLVRRDLRFLRWRYDEIPSNTGYRRYYLTRRGAVIGYAVLRTEPWRGSMVGRIVDYLAPRRWLRALLALTLQELNSMHAAAVFVEQLHEGSERTLRALGCFRAQAGTRFIANVSRSASPLRGLLSQRGEWCVNRADSDLDHEATYTPARS